MNKLIFTFKPHSKITNSQKLFFSGAGFTLIETMVALAILSFISTGLMLFIGSISRSVTLIKDQTIAINLVQEGLEVTRNIRDSAWFSGGNFSSSLPNGDRQVQWDSTSFLFDNGKPLKIDNNKIYQYVTGTDTKFKRVISISEVSAVEKKIISTVSWQVYGGTKTVSAELRLFDWK